MSDSNWNERASAHGLVAATPANVLPSSQFYEDLIDVLRSIDSCLREIRALVTPEQVDEVSEASSLFVELVGGLRSYLTMVISEGRKT